MSHGLTTAIALPERGGRRTWARGWVLPALCVVLGAVLIAGNPNYRWLSDREVPYGADFLQEWVAGDMLLHGAAESIYDPVAFAQWQHDRERIGFEWPESQFYPAVYPPPYYCLVAPLAALPYRAAAPVWLAMMLAAFPLAVWLVERKPWGHGVCRGVPIHGSYAFWCLALLFPAIFMSLVMGQKGTLWMLIAVASWQAWRAERSFVAGCLWALLTVKPTLCCWLPLVMLMLGQWRFCAGVVVGSVALWGTTALIVPASMWSDFFQVVLNSGTYQVHAGYREGWSASLLTLLNALGLPRGASLGLWSLCGAGLLLSLVALPRGLSPRERLERPEFLLQMLIATALLSPHFYFYDLVWLIFPLGGLLVSSPRRTLAYLAVLWLSMLVAQQFETGWPILGLALLAIFGHSVFTAETQRAR